MGWRERIAQITGRRPAVQPCKAGTADICVIVSRPDGIASGLAGFSVALTGPTPGTMTTDASGVAEFAARKPGAYKFTVTMPPGAEKKWKMSATSGQMMVGGGSVGTDFIEIHPIGTLIVRVYDDLNPRNRVRAKAASSVAYLDGSDTAEHSAADLYMTVAAGSVTVNATATQADLYAGDAGQKTVNVAQGGTGIAEFVLPVINRVTPKLEPEKDEVWFLRPDPPPPQGGQAPNWPALPQEPAITLRASLSETQPGKTYTGNGTLTFDATALAIYRDASCTGPALTSGAALTNAELKSGLTLYVKGRERNGAANVQLALAPSGNPTILVQADAQKPLAVREVNVVEPKIQLEYKVVLWDRGLHAHQKDANGVVETKLFKADPTRVELSVTQRGGDVAYTRSGKVEASNCDVFLDEECKQPFNTSTPIAVGVMSNSPYVLWLRGKTRGQFDLKLTLTDGPDPHIHVRGPAVEKMGVVELEAKLFQHDEAALANETFDANKDTLDAYFTALKDKVIPEQKVMTDAQKVFPGRMLHAQKDGGHGRAKLVLKARDASQWPPGTDDYTVHINRSNASGAVELFDAETDGNSLPFPAPRDGIKASALDADKTWWVEGKEACSDWRGVMLDVTLVRPESSPGCTLPAEPKRNADWARFTVVKIKEIKLDYQPEPNKAVAWNDTDKRFYINLKAGDAGRKVKLAVELTAKLKDVPIHFMLATHVNNGKTANWNVDLPATWKWGTLDKAIKTGDRSEPNKLLHQSKKTDANGKADLELLLSRFGGDVLEPAAYITQDPHLAKYVQEHADLKKRKPVCASHTITVWRKIWVKRIDVQGMTAREFGGAIGQYERVKVEMISLPPLVLPTATVNGYSPQAIYPRYMIEVGGGNADALVVSDPNKGNFFTTFSIDGDKPNTIPILVCDAQWDPKGTTSAKSGDALASAFPLPITFQNHVNYNVGILSPPLQGGDLFVQGEWEAKDAALPPASGWVNVRSGQLSSADVTIDPGRTSVKTVSVSLPAGVGPVNATTRVWIKNLKVQRAGIYLGESFQKRILAVYDPTDPGDFQNTIAHEIGHAYHQVIEGDPAGGVAGVPRHPNQLNASNQGNHCRYNTNVCVMYDSGTPAGGGRLDNYCPVCQPYLLVQDMTTIT